MYLKRISIQGFKSFADRVDFEFARGVTCIVGPNGCGKSNVIDAFKWVLGEQSAKSLRGRQMTDMIFNGSTTRKSSSLARVDLFFDNADHTLPLDADEVCITRKLYRSGESEYLVNESSSRLKDIREMFLDTGVGADTYSIIEQGRVDGLLTASSTERRAIFEEAAGIGRYKARKREAQRKLDRTDQNLLRVEDIVEEVEKRLRSVKLQAGKARNFQTYEARLRELRSSFSLAEYHRLTLAIQQSETQAHEAGDESTSLRTHISQGEADASRLVESVDRITEELSTTEQSAVRVRADIAAHEERVASAKQRIEEHCASLSRVDERVATLGAQKTEYETQLAALHEQAEVLQKETHEGDARARDLTARDQELDRNVTEVRALLDDEKEGLVDLMRRSTQLRNEITQLNTQSENLKATQTRLDERDAIIRAELEEHLRRKSKLDARSVEIERLIEDETGRLQQKRAEAQNVEARRGELAEALGTAKEERSAVGSKLQVLAELERKMEGVGAGVRALLEMKAARPDDETLSSIHGMVSDLFEADHRHASVIEAAIGDLDQYLVLADSRTFLARRELFENLPGRVNAICLDRLPAVINEHEFGDHPGFVSVASGLVRCREEYGYLVRNLLGRTIVVRTLDDALTMSAAESGSRRFVTLAGEVVEPTGSVSLGPSSSRAGLISRKSERRALGAELEAIEERARSLDDELSRANAEASHLRDVQEDLRTALAEAGNARVEAATALQSVNESVCRLTDEQPLIAGEVAMIETQIEEANRLATERDASAGELDAKNEEREQAVTAHSENLAKLTEERERVRCELTELRVTLGKLGTRRASLADGMNHLRHGILSASEAIEAAEHERVDGGRRIEESEEAILVAQEELDELAATSERLEAAVIQLRRRREMVRVESEELAAKMRSLRSNLEEVESQLHNLQMHEQESRVRRDELVARIREELEIDLADQYAEYDHAEQNWEEVEAEIAELRDRISRLGNVNLDAITEQTELEERQGFLTTQRDDLDNSKLQLEELIGRLDLECKERFEASFCVIRDNFKDIFRKLFGGGKADIILENPDDVLESGIEILAKPPGKDLQRISLMSGGEKTMTAIALLMGIFRSRPSPLALLDEVDAALDEANNERFNHIIQEFLDQSQFLLVTHSKRTMAIADHLYGVTMQEPGVSTRVSVKFDDDGDRTAVA